MITLKTLAYAFFTAIEIVKNKFLYKHRVGLKGIKPFRNIVRTLSIKMCGQNSFFVLPHSKIIASKVTISGKSNVLSLSGLIIDTSINIAGTDNAVYSYEGAEIHNAHIVVKGHGLKLIIKENATLGYGCWIVIMGNNQHLIIGKNSMIADEVDIWASDTHPIVDKVSSSIINPSGSIDLEEHVWIGKKTTILKNVRIGKDSVIGMGSVVTKDIPPGSIAVGNPAHIVKGNVDWRRGHINV